MRVNNCTPFSFANFLASIIIWISWLCDIKIDGFFCDEMLHLLKCFTVGRNKSFFIQLLELLKPWKPGGVAFSIKFLKFFRRNTNTGGNVVPFAAIKQYTVTNEPLSTETILRTCSVPFAANTLLGFWTVWTPVSSKLKMWEPYEKYVILSNCDDEKEERNWMIKIKRIYFQMAIFIVEMNLVAIYFLKNLQF